MFNQTPYGQENDTFNEFNEADLEFGNVEFAENPEPRCPCILLLDVSGSMTGKPISELNRGLRIFKEQLQNDELASKRVEVAVITFETKVRICNEFQTADRFEPEYLTTGGCTSMGEAIETAINILDERKNEYKQNGISYYRPWIFLITDGAPTDSVDVAARKVHDGENSKQFAFFAVGTEDADMYKLKEISVREPLVLDGLNFSSLFQWLSNSMSSVSRSNLDAEVMLEAPSGWAKI